MFACCKKEKKTVLKRTYSVRSATIQSPRLSTVDPDMVEWKEQLSQGDQSYESRLAFWNGGLCMCVKCGSRAMERMEEQSGVLTNGDAYGVIVFNCKRCGWNTSFDFDDGSFDCWYYEATEWPRGIMHFPTSYMVAWARKHQLPENVDQIIRNQRISGNILLDLDKKQHVASTLSISQSTANHIHSILQDRFGAVLTTTNH